MFITFEGTEGSGKTTQIKLLAEQLRSLGHDVVETREPGGTEIGRQVRAVLHAVSNDAMTSQAEILLYAADRAQHVNQIIRPALAEGKIVLCDRYIDSTYAYQGYGRALDLGALKMITGFATDGLNPDLTLYLKIDSEIGLKRRVQGNLEMNRMDLQKQAFYKRVEDGYEALMQSEPARWRQIDATGSIEAVQALLVETVLAALAVG